MAYSVWYCNQQLNHYREYINDLTSDIDKLQQMASILSKSEGSVAEGSGKLKNLSGKLSDGMSGYKAQGHISNLSSLASMVGDLQNEISSSVTTVNGKISYCQSEIASAQNKVKYWANQRNIALAALKDDD